MRLMSRMRKKVRLKARQEHGHEAGEVEDVLLDRHRTAERG